MEYSDQILSVIELAKDKYNERQYLHAERVAKIVEKDFLFQFYDDKTKVYLICLAYLHDILEDTNVSEEELAKVGFSNNKDLKILTHDLKRKNYFDYTLTIFEKGSPAAQLIKRADMCDHLSLKDTLTGKLKKKYQNVAKIYMKNNSWNFAE